VRIRGGSLDWCGRRAAFRDGDRTLIISVDAIQRIAGSTGRRLRSRTSVRSFSPDIQVQFFLLQRVPPPFD